MSDLDALTAFLSDPVAYPEGGAVERRETHVSLVFLTNGYAYKLCKPVDFGFLDFTTLEARYVDCWNEVLLNRRLAPDVYLGVVPVTERGGAFELGGNGRPVEWLVRMRRLPDEATLAAKVEAATASTGDVDRLLDVLLPFFDAAERGPEIDADETPEAIRRRFRDNLDVLDEADPEAIDPREVVRLRSAAFGFLVRRRALFEQRIAEGRIRNGHGDLRAEHVYLFDPPVVVDGIEFLSEFRHLDTLDEIGFLAMDLERLGRADLAGRLRDRYRARTDDDAPEELFGFYEAYRYSVRAKVACLRAGELSGSERRASFDEAAGELRSAIERLRPFSPASCLVVCGLSGTGKSTVAAPLADELGAEHVRSDVVRKELHGFDAEDHEADPAVLYSHEASRRTYGELARRAAESVRDGTSVVLDATYQRRADRDRLRAALREVGATPVFVELTCPAEVAEARIRERSAAGADASDADVSVYRRQRASFEPLEEVGEGERIRVDGRGEPAGVVGRIVRRLAGV